MWEVFGSALVLVRTTMRRSIFPQTVVFGTRPDFDAFAVICGLIWLVIAEVFLAGTRLDEEQSLTV